MKIFRICLSVTTLIILFASLSRAQSVSGLIYEKMQDGKRGSLPGVNVYWAGTTLGTFTDDKGKYIMVAAKNNTQAAAPSKGYSTITFTAAGGAYKMWFKTLAPTTANNSFWIKIDGGAWKAWNENSVVSKTWKWNLYTNLNLTAGTHTLTIAYREEGTKMDKIAISNDPAYNP